MSKPQPPAGAGDGLARVVAGKSSISSIDGTAGALRYRGYDIHELTPSSPFEETVWLLWQGELPDRTELADFTTLLAGQRQVRVMGLLVRVGSSHALILHNKKKSPRPESNRGRQFTKLLLCH